MRYTVVVGSQISLDGSKTGFDIDSNRTPHKHPESQYNPWGKCTTSHDDSEPQHSFR